MSTDELLAVLVDRGLALYFCEADGRPHLKGPREALTPALVRVLAYHRDRILARLCPREFLWRTGHTHRENPGEVHPGFGPAGAWWYRRAGQGEWQGIPGTPGEHELPGGGKGP